MLNEESEGVWVSWGGCPLVLAQGGPIFHSGCEGKLGSALELLQGTPGEGNGYPLQDSCLENFMDRGAWWAIVHAHTA